MDKKECNAELDAAGVPSKGRSMSGSGPGIAAIRDLVRRLRAGEPAASLKVPRKPKSAEELFCCDKAEQLACRATLVADGAKKVVFQYGRPGNGTDYLVARWRGLAETDPLRLEFDELARRDVAAAAADELPVDRLQRAPDPGLVNLPTIWPRMRYAQPECGVRYPYGSKLGLFKGRCFGCCVWAQCAARPEEFPNLLKALATVPRVSLYLTAVDVNDMETLRARARMCYRVIRDAKRRIANAPPRAEDDQCPAYYGVDFVSNNGSRNGGKLVCQYTVHEGMKTLKMKSAPADPRFEAIGHNAGSRGNVLSHPTAVAVYRERLERKNRIAGGIAVFNFPWHPYARRRRVPRPRVVTVSKRRRRSGRWRTPSPSSCRNASTASTIAAATRARSRRSPSSRARAAAAAVSSSSASTTPRSRRRRTSTSARRSSARSSASGSAGSTTRWTRRSPRSRSPSRRSTASPRSSSRASRRSTSRAPRPRSRCRRSTSRASSATRPTSRSSSRIWRTSRPRTRPTSATRPRRWRRPSPCPTAPGRRSTRTRGASRARASRTRSSA
mmetsp:Transcript_18445/g.64037  ORF Transcript_18445/g.64037 Transcript_18445/m.64037 type:complete len:557 (-) Transcript_18445:257-1927(-)